jgi:hypothetical protein
VSDFSPSPADRGQGLTFLFMVSRIPSSKKDDSGLIKLQIRQVKQFKIRASGSKQLFV